MATKLNAYNNALMLCGERTLASVTENREPRRLLDQVYDSGAIKTCLEAGFWNFAARTVQIEYDPGVDPDFGFERAFVKPSDWCRTMSVSPDEYSYIPYKSHEFADEAGYWWADIDTLYVKYVSDGASYGGDLTKWTESFARYFEAYLASRIAWKLTRDKDTVAMLEDEAKKRLKSAVGKDAQDTGTSMAPEGAWNRSRRGGRLRRDGGTRGSLIG